MATAVLIVGGGIVGSFAAYRLADRGVATTLIDRSGVGRQASGQNPGGINPLHGPGIPGPLAAFAMESFREHVEAASVVREFAGVDFGWRAATRLHLAFDESDLPSLEAALRAHQETSGFSASWLERGPLRLREPRIHPSVRAGVLTTGNIAVDAAAYTRAVAAAAQARGASIVEANVTGVAGERPRARGVRIGDRVLEGDAIVIAPGPWASEPATWLGCDLRVEPVRGDLLLAGLDGAPLRDDLTWRSTGIYPVAGDVAWIGGTEERSGFDVRPRTDVREGILDRAARVLPALAGASIRRHVVGLRPVTPDGLPVIGRAPGWENVYLADGAGRKGMLLGAGMGRAIADLVQAGTTTASIAACRPDRFGSE